MFFIIFLFFISIFVFAILTIYRYKKFYLLSLKT